MENRFARVLHGKYFRVYPVSWYSWIGLRVEFYGCVYGKISLEWRSFLISKTWNEKCRGNCTLTELNFKSDSVWQKVKETSMWSPNFESFFYEISYEKVYLTYLDPEITNCAWSIIWKGRLSWLEHSTQYHNSESFRFPDTITQIFSNQFLFH